MGSIDTKPASNFIIPTVDLSPYLLDANSPAAHDVVTQIRDACMTSGFFQITGHGVEEALQDAVFQAARTLFDLPHEEKLKLKSAPGRGYETIGSQVLEPGTKPDMKEGYFIGPELSNPTPPFRNFRYPNKWPSESLISSSSFREPILKYRSLLCDLSLTLMRILASGLPGHSTRHANIFDEFCTDPLAVVRLLHYPPQLDLTDPKQLGAGAHTDFGAITLLLQDQSGGLQVLNQHSGEWIDVPPAKNGYVVNVGDMLDMWTKGEYRSNIHRVINRSGGHRYSVPFFFDGNLDYVLKPLDGTMGGEEITVEEHMKRRYKQTATI